MRDRATIDSELRRLAEVRRSIREHGGELSTRQIDELLDERLGHRPGPSEPRPSPSAGRRPAKSTALRPAGPMGLRRLGLFAALPISVGAVTAAFVVMSTVHNPDPAAQPIVAPPSTAGPAPAAPQPPAAGVPKASAPLPNIVDRAFVDALKQEGVPVPSNEYATAKGHAVCDFLAHQANFTEAVNFVQRTSIWDANQSADVAAGAVVSYCPDHKPGNVDQVQQPVRDASSDLQRIEDDLHRIRSDLQGIRDGLPAIPGQ
jgi:hypothetical protein